MNYCFNEAVFTYLFGCKRDERFANFIRLGSHVLNYTGSTEVSYDSYYNCSILIIGYCCDSHGEIEIENIPREILSHHNETIENIYNYCDRFAGKYVIILKKGEKEYIWGDAICSLQINYNTQGDTCISSVDKFVADSCSYSESLKSLDIRRNAINDEQPLPYNLTMYDNVKALLPNHFLDIQEKTSHRVSINRKKDLDTKQILEHTHLLIHNVALSYSKKYNLLCPLTSGYDSRMVLSFLKKVVPGIACYTTKLSYFTETHTDLTIPYQISKKEKLQYSVINWNPAPKDYLDTVLAIAGESYSTNTINEGFSNKTAFGNCTIVNGHISDQIGKSLLGNAIPDSLATASYFQCKVHNHSKYAKKALDEYFEEMKNEPDKFDLFSWEIDCGRWVPQSLMLYSLMGVNSMNLFNCREIILLWMQIPRKKRIHKIIHNYSFVQNDLIMNNIPINPNQKFKFVYKYWWLYYISSFIRHYLG